MRFTAIDFETANSSRSSVCAVGLAVVEDGHIVKRTHQLLRPHPPIFDPFNISIHGITADDVAEAPSFEDYWPILWASIQGPLVAHNAAFDIVHFAPWMTDPLTLCTLKAARVIYPEADNHKLTTLKYYLGLDGCHDRAHSADEDVNVLLQLVKRMCQDAEC